MKFAGDETDEADGNIKVLGARLVRIVKFKKDEGELEMTKGVVRRLLADGE